MNGLGIIGQGFVGNAVYKKFRNYYDVATYDLDSSKANATFDEVCQNNSFELMPKGLLLVNISDNNGLNTTIKHLNK